MRRINFILDIIVRYLILLIIGIIGLRFFYFIFSPLTIYPVYFLLNIFFNASLSSNIITINSNLIEIIGPCIAGSAYFLLLILNFSTRDIKLKKRITLLLFSFLLLLIVNIIRIFFLSLLLISGFSFFDLAHKLFWYAGSIIFVVGIWFLSIKIFKIKKIPFYSDIIFLLKSGKKTKKTKCSKKNQTS